MYKIKTIALLIISIIIITSCSKGSLNELEKSVFEIQGESGFVGTVNGTDAFIALLIAEDEAIVYVCNGEEKISEWFRGAISDPANISLTNSSGAQVSCKFEGNSFTGSVVLRNANAHSFSATPNTGIKTGLFRVHGDQSIKDEVVVGWILNSSGEERGSFRFKSVFQKTPRKPKMGDINDGTSNTLLLNGRSFPIERFFLIRSGSFSFVSRNG